MAATFQLSCTDCGYTMPENEFTYLCPVCSTKQNSHEPPRGVMKTVYNYNEIKKSGGKDLFQTLHTHRFLDLLPLKQTKSLGILKVGDTPLYRFKTTSDTHRNLEFYLKDDSQQPTFSFKDRASVVVSAYAKEHKIDTIVAASTGNAGSSLAGICASQKQKAVIIVPKTAPPAKLVQIIMYGAIPVLVDGNYDAAFELSLQASRHFGWFNRNTAYNPFTIEGKKTVSFEIYSQLNGNLPSYIFVPVGDGVIIAGVYKGFEDLLELGIISHIPVLVAVQSEKSDNLVRNMNNAQFEMKPATTLADSISVDYPRNFYMARQYLQKYHGRWLTVSDEDIQQAASLLARETGVFAEPAASAAMAGMLRMADELPADKPSLVLSTGSGLKDIKTPLQKITIPEPVQADINSLQSYLNHIL